MWGWVRGIIPKLCRHKRGGYQGNIPKRSTTLDSLGCRGTRGPRVAYIAVLSDYARVRGVAPGLGESARVPAMVVVSQDAGVLGRGVAVAVGRLDVPTLTGVAGDGLRDHAPVVLTVGHGEALRISRPGH